MDSKVLTDNIWVKRSLVWTLTRVMSENPVTTDFFMLPFIILIFRIFKPITSSEISIEYSSEESDCIPGISALIGRQDNSEPLRVTSKGRLENSKIPSKIGQWRVAGFKWWNFHFLIILIFDPKTPNFLTQNFSHVKIRFSVMSRDRFRFGLGVRFRVRFRLRVMLRVCYLFFYFTVSYSSKSLKRYVWKSARHTFNSWADFDSTHSCKKKLINFEINKTCFKRNYNEQLVLNKISPKSRLKLWTGLKKKIF